MVKKILVGTSLFVVGAGCLGGCRTPKGDLSHSSQSKVSIFDAIQPLKSSLSWTKTLPGAISGIALSEDGKSVLVSTSPEPEILGSSNRYLLSWYSAQGNVVWTKVMDSPVKELDLAPDGSFAVISNYSDEIFSWDRHGKLLWKTQGSCRPHLLSYSKKILCYHDDDGDASVAFDVLDWKGHKVFSYFMQPDEDVLALKISSNSRYAAIGMTKGQVAVFDLSFNSPASPLLWKAVVPGEVVDVAPSGDYMAVLYEVLGKGRRLSLFGRGGMALETKVLSNRPVQVELVARPGGETVYYYGNDKQGQYLGSFQAPKLDGSWEQGIPVPLEYSSYLTVRKSTVWLGYEEIPASLHLLRINNRYPDADIRQLKMASDPGASIFAYRVSSDTSVSVLATDNGKLSYYSNELF